MVDRVTTYELGLGDRIFPGAPFERVSEMQALALQKRHHQDQV